MKNQQLQLFTVTAVLCTMGAQRAGRRLTAALPGFQGEAPEGKKRVGKKCQDNDQDGHKE